MLKIDVLVVRIVTFFMFTAILMTGQNNALKISNIIEIVGATRSETKNITQKDLVIGTVTEMVITDLENVNLIVLTEIIKTDEENIEADHEVVVTMMIIIIRKRNDDIAVKATQKKRIDLVNLLSMENP